MIETTCIAGGQPAPQTRMESAMKCSMKSWIIGCTLGATALLAAPFAQADSVLLSESSHISGTQSALYALDAPGAGKLSVQLDNLAWPERLSTLSFALTTATGVVQTLSDAGTASIDIGSAGKYYALVTGTAQGRWNLGMYSLRVSFSSLGTTPVPLPGTFVLLLSAAAALGFRNLNWSALGKKTVTYAA